ncbi:unnamed protein product [Camellia sinensis]
MRTQKSWIYNPMTLVDYDLSNQLAFLVGELFGHVRKRQPWVDLKIVKQLIDANLYALLGKRTATDDEKPIKKKNEKPVKVEVKLTKELHLAN